MFQSGRCLSLLFLVLLWLSRASAASEIQDESLLRDCDESGSLIQFLLPSSTNIFVMWGLVTDADSYQLTWTDSDTIEDNVDVNSTTEYYKIDNLPPCTQFQVQVDAKNGSDTLICDKTTTQTLPQASSPVEKLNFTQIEDSSTLEVNWTPVTPPGNCTVEYIVTWNSSLGFDETTTTETQYTITDLSYDTYYEVCVIPSVEGVEPETTKCDEATLTKRPEESPENVTVTDIRPESLTVSWEPPAISIITDYAVSWRLVGDQEDSQEKNATTTDTTYMITSLVPCSEYDVTVSVSNNKGYGPPSEPVTDTTSAKLPDAPQNLKVTDQQTTSLTMAWQPPPAVGNCELLGYRIHWTNKMDPELLEKNTLTYKISGLTPSTTYTISVEAHTTAGWGEAAQKGEKTMAESDPNVGAIVGGVIGGLVVVALVVAAVVKRDSLKKMAKRGRGRSKDSSRSNSMTMDQIQKM